MLQKLQAYANSIKWTKLVYKMFKTNRGEGGRGSQWLFEQCEKTPELVNWDIPQGVGDNKDGDNTNDSVADSHLDYVGQGGLGRRA